MVLRALRVFETVADGAAWVQWSGTSPCSSLGMPGDIGWSERELGMPLLHRGRGGSTPTEQNAVPLRWPAGS